MDAEHALILMHCNGDCLTPKVICVRCIAWADTKRQMVAEVIAGEVAQSSDLWMDFLPVAQDAIMAYEKFGALTAHKEIPLP